MISSTNYSYKISLPLREYIYIGFFSMLINNRNTHHQCCLLNNSTISSVLQILEQTDGFSTDELNKQTFQDMLSHRNVIQWMKGKCPADKWIHWSWENGWMEFNAQHWQLNRWDTASNCPGERLNRKKSISDWFVCKHASILFVFESKSTKILCELH